jgi:hypothetical protein
MRKLSYLLFLMLCSNVMIGQNYVIDTSFNNGGAYSISTGYDPQYYIARYCDIIEGTGGRYLYAINLEEFGPDEEGEIKMVDGTSGENLFYSFPNVNGNGPDGYDTRVNALFLNSQNNLIAVVNYDSAFGADHINLVNFVNDSVAVLNTQWGPNNDGVLRVYPFAQNTSLLYEELLEVSSGDYYLLGQEYNYVTQDRRSYVVKIDATGNIVTSFGNNGIKYLNMGSSEFYTIGDAVELSSGKIMIGGAQLWQGQVTTYSAFVMQLTSDFDLDLSFTPTAQIDTATAYFSFADAPSRQSFVSKIVEDANGNITLFGNGQVYTSQTSYWNRPAIVRILANGNIDPTFNGGAVLKTSFGGDRAYLSNGNVLANGKILVFGGVRDNQLNPTELSTIILENDGALDSVYHLTANFVESYPYSSAITSDNGIVWHGTVPGGQSPYIEYLVGKLIAQNPTNIIQTPFAQNIEIYPNPTSNIVQVEFEGEAFIQLFDIMGQELISKTAVGQTQINLSDYPVGAYFINVNGYSQKVIKQ